MENKEVTKNNKFNLTTTMGLLIGTYFIGFIPMMFLYGLFNMCISPSLKYINIMLSSIIFYCFGFVELCILIVSLVLLYVNTNCNLKTIFLYDILKKTHISVLNKYKSILNKFTVCLNNFFESSFVHYIYNCVNKLEHLLNNIYKKSLVIILTIIKRLNKNSNIDLLLKKCIKHIQNKKTSLYDMMFNLYYVIAIGNKLYNNDDVQ